MLFQNVLMSVSIEKIVVFFCFVTMAVVMNTTDLAAQAPFYSSPRSCVLDAGTPPTSGTGGGTGGGTGTTPTGGCDAPTVFFDTDTTSRAWTWNFGDGSPTATNARKINHQYLAAGTFNATLTRTSAAGVTQTISKIITVGDYPSQPLFNKKNNADTTVCNGKKLTLNPYELTLAPSNVKYLWFPTGETTKTIEVDSSGCYSVEVINTTTGCSRTAVIKVKFCLQPAAAGGGSENWYFGNGATLDFQLKGTLTSNRDSLATEGGVFSNDSTLTDASFSPRESSRDNKVNTTGGSAMVYGPDGALKFYTDGKGIYDDDDEALKDIAGNPIALNLDPTSQGLSIIPKSSCNECPHHQYYVFGVDKTTKTLSYTVVDMRYSNRKGAVVETNVPVLYPVTDRIMATPNADSTGFIIIAHEANSNKYRFISVDSTGVSETTQAVGFVQDVASSQQGYQVISPNGRFMAVGIVKNGKNYVEIYRIDKQPTGISLGLDKTIELDAAPPNIYGLAFGNNSDILYVSMQGDGATIPSRLYQLPLFVGDAAAIAAAKNLIDESLTDIFGALQLGPVNGGAQKYIYMAIDGATELPYIQVPDARGNASVVGYTRVPGSANQGVAIPGTSRFGFPNVVFANQDNEGDGIQATYNGNCFKSPTVLEIQEVCSPMRNEIEWIFDGGKTKKKGGQVSYTFPKVGWNKIQVKIQTFSETAASKAISAIGNIPVATQLLKNSLEAPCRDTIITDSIYIKPSPSFVLADSAFICTKDNPPTFISITPNPTGGNTFTYNWLTGLGTRITGTTGATTSYTVVALGNYRLEIVNNFDCEAAKNFKIIDKCEPRVLVPSAFSPNNDNKNEELVVYTAHIEDYNLLIFNRWGEVIFESTNPDGAKWNGEVNGKIFSPMVYPYVIRFRSTDFPERGVLKEEGSITVIR